MSQNNQTNSPFPTAINKGGTGVTSVTTAPTSSSWSGWDANKNYSAVGFIPGYTTTVTSASPVVLTVGSNQQQYFTGSTAQTLTMPVANTLVTGQNWSVINNSSAVVTIQSSGANTILALPAASETVVTCVLASGTSAASWVTSPAVSGSGTVNSGLINQLAWYAASGTAVSGLTIVNSAGLTTTSGGVPTWVAYTGTNAPVLGTAPTISSPKIDQINDQAHNLPLIAFSGSASAVNYLTCENNTTGNNPALVATGTDTNITLQLQGKGTSGVYLVGVSTNSSAPAGGVGEFVSSIIPQASKVSITTTNTATDMTSISLTAGDWDVWGNITFIPGASTNITYVLAWLSLTSATLPDASLYNINNYGTAGLVAASVSIGKIAPPLRVSIASTTTVYITGYAGFTVSTIAMCGGIYARRVR